MEEQWILVDKGSKTPIARQIAEAVLLKIEERRLTPGDRLPTERWLAQQNGIARGTVKAAYRDLEAMGIVQTRQGSGTFVRRDEGLAARVQKKKAVKVLQQTIGQLKGLGLQTEEIHQLMDICLSQSDGKSLNIALVADNPEMLLDIKRQLSYLPQVFLSIFLLDSITQDQSPEKLLGGFDIILTPTSHYPDMAGLLPGLKRRLMEAATAPSNETLVAFTALPRSSRIGIICRTNVFLGVVREVLLSFGFREDCILSFFEMNYTVDTYFPGGIDALISFSDAHIFTNPAFACRNEEFAEKGGKMIVFRHQIQQGTLIYIEDRVRQLLNQKEPGAAR